MRDEASKGDQVSRASVNSIKLGSSSIALPVTLFSSFRIGSEPAELLCSPVNRNSKARARANETEGIVENYKVP